MDVKTLMPWVGIEFMEIHQAIYFWSNAFFCVYIHIYSTLVKIIILINDFKMYYNF